MNSIAFIMPRYNSKVSARCIFMAKNVPAGQSYFEIQAFDTLTQAPSESTELSGYYVVVPRG